MCPTLPRSRNTVPPQYLPQLLTLEYLPQLLTLEHLPQLLTLEHLPQLLTLALLHIVTYNYTLTHRPAEFSRYMYLLLMGIRYREEIRSWWVGVRHDSIRSCKFISAFQHARIVQQVEGGEEDTMAQICH